MELERVPDYWPADEILRHGMLDYAPEVEHAAHHPERMIAELDKHGGLDNTL